MDKEQLGAVCIYTVDQPHSGNGDRSGLDIKCRVHNNDTMDQLYTLDNNIVGV